MFGKFLFNQLILPGKLKLSIDNVLSNLEATFLALNISGNASWKNQFPVKMFFFPTSSETIPQVCLAGTVFFFFSMSLFKKNTYVEVFGVKHIKLGVIFVLQGYRWMCLGLPPICFCFWTIRER